MINSNVNQIIYQGNGVVKQFSYPFVIVDKSDIKLTLVDTDGTETAITKDYYIDANSSVVYYPGYAPGTDVPEADQPPVLATGQKLVIYRQVPVTQLSSLSDVWPFNVIEAALDKLTMICQQFSSVFSRCLKVSEAHASFNSTIPVEPNKAIEINADGTGFALADSPSEVRAECVVIRNSAAAIRDEARTYKDNAQGSATSASTSAGSASSSASLAQAWAQSTGSPDGVDGNKSSKTWAEIAKGEADEANRQAIYCTAMAAEGALYDESTTYEPGDACMTPEGTLWRCIAESTGESPSTSAKFVMVAMVSATTFEMDENGDLMPLMYPKQSSQFDVDENGDVMPAL